MAVYVHRGSGLGRGGRSLCDRQLILEQGDEETRGIIGLLLSIPNKPIEIRDRIGQLAQLVRGVLADDRGRAATRDAASDERVERGRFCGGGTRVLLGFDLDGERGL